MRKYLTHICFLVSLFSVPFNLSCSNACCADTCCHYECFDRADCCSEPECSSCMDPFLVYGTYSFGDSPGIRQQYGTAGVLVTPCFCPCQFSPLLDVSFNYLDDGRWGTTALLGFRLGSDFIFYGGGYIAYDYMEGEFQNYHQIGLGVEFIGKCFELRANGYIPVSVSDARGPITIYDDYDNFGATTPYVATVQTEEYALTGFDAEIGPRFSCNFMDAFLGVGPYYYEHHDFGDYWGVRGVLRVAFSNLVYFEGQVTHDDHNHTLGRGTIGVSIPLGLICNPCQVFSCDCKTQRPFYREKPIHIEDCCRYTTNW